MNARLLQFARNGDGRYLTPDERSALMNYADSIPQRLDVADAVEKAEDGVIRAVIEEMKTRYPNFAKYHEQGWAKCFRDLQLVVRQDVQSMILDDVRLLDDKILFWLRTIFAAYNFTPAFCRDAFSLLRDKMKEQIPSRDFDLIHPYFDRNIEVMADFPEPAVPAV